MDDYYVPIFITSDVLMRGGDIPLKGGKVRPFVDEENVSVSIGKAKLFSLPFWKCHQTSNMTIISDYPISHMLFSHYIENKHIERYLNSRMSKYKDSGRLIEMGKEETNFLLGEIQKHKIYDIDWNKIFEIKHKGLQEVITKNSTLQKSYEKKFLSDYNIYLQKKEIKTKEMIEKEQKEKRKNEFTRFRIIGL